MNKDYRTARRAFRLAVFANCFLLFAAANSFSQTDQQPFVELLNQAETATAAKDWKTAALSWQQVVDANPVNARFWDQLAGAYYESKEYRKAIAAYEQAIKLGAGFPSNAAFNIACCYALLGEKEKALEWLQRAFDMGFRNLEHSQKDTDLVILHDDPRFKKIVGLEDVSKMSRVEGWRYDLALLEREVSRKGYAYPVSRPVSKEQFKTAVKTLSDQVPSLTDAQMVVEIMKLMRKLGDGHTGLLAPPRQPEYALALPLQFYSFKEGLFIIAADPKLKDLLGAQVLKLGGHTIDKVMQSLDPIINRDNEIWPSQVGPYHMRSLPLLSGLGLVADTKKVELSIRDAAGKDRSVTVETDSLHPSIWNDFPGDWITYAQSLGTTLPLYLKNTKTNYWFEYLPDSKTVYFQYNRVRNDEQEPLARFAERLFAFVDEHEVEKLVIDMRWNNGGNTFLSQPLLHGLIASKKINQRGKLFVIIGRRTYSAAQNTATFFERHTRAIFVGEPTGSSPNFVGEETPFTLPYSKVLVNVSDLYWQSAWPMDYRTWIAPQIYIPPTFAAYRANRDPAMEAVVGYK
jgi:tetratricopeptide (TPR) repeat protein